jgi:NAD(P)-dependent dehydrogenase (short-subunit alcohol dehydrogenase family)
MKKVCLVIGAGRGIGGHVAKRFALAADEKERYHSFLVRRSDPTQLNASIEEIQSLGGMASGKLVDILNPDSIEQLIPSIEQDIGPIDTCVYNIGAQFGFQSLHKTSLKQLELGWKLGVQGLFRLSKALLPFWEERGGGTLLVTSSTAALRGNPGQLSHTSAMGGRRMLCQSLNAELARKNIHVVRKLYL